LIRTKGKNEIMKNEIMKNENNVIEMKTKKEQMMETKKVKFEDIKTPTTVEEFRTNLKRYYLNYGKDSIFVMDGDDSFGIPYSKISSFDDIYKLTKTGFGFGGGSPTIIPLALCGVDWYDGTSVGFWSDPNSDIKVFNRLKGGYQKMTELPLNVARLDDQFYRGFFSKSLGEFSGYDADCGWVEGIGEKFRSTFSQ
jgi:hypothetical protein